MGEVCRSRAALLMLSLVVATAGLRGQGQPPVQPPRVFGEVPPPVAPAAIEKLSLTAYRVGNVRIDTVSKEVTATGVVNDVAVLEFIANTKGGYKSYESLIELDTNAIDFNVGLILIGLERERSVTPRFHFDPNVPQGDPVEVTVSWEDERGKRRKVQAEELVYNETSKKTLPKGPWVYTGSTFITNSTAFVADLDGVLIGFVHSPAPLIEHPAPMVGPYPANQPNKKLGLKPGTRVELTVRALPQKKK